MIRYTRRRLSRYPHIFLFPRHNIPPYCFFALTYYPQATHGSFIYELIKGTRFFLALVANLASYKLTNLCTWTASSKYSYKNWIISVGAS